MKRHSLCSALALLLLVCLGLAGCGGKTAPEVKGPYAGPPCMDVLTLPQDLTAYAANAGKSRPLLEPSLQADAAARQKETLYRPWRLSKPTRWVRQSLGKNFNMRPGGAYTDNKEPFPQSVWDGLVANSNKKAYGKGAGPAITLRHTNLRAMPTAMRYYLKPDRPGEGYPFDYLQHTSAPPGTPVYICNISADGLWVLVESAATSGWLPARDVAGVDAAFMERWQRAPLAALVRDHVPLGEGAAHIGALLPLAGDAPAGFGHALAVLYPRRDASGKAAIDSLTLPPDAAVAVPLPLSADAVARVGNQMMGQAYSWGGLDEKRDCSALTRDLFAPFGFWLPRNSSAQARVGRVIDVAGLSNAEKEAVITREGVPFRSLVWLRGHIGVYLGVYEGKGVIYHNMWGLRTRDASGGCEGRAVVGKAVVTTLRPGVERPDLCNPGSFLDRIERATVLPQ